ncbi:MAG: cytochrome c nitrite reductase small subunit [Ignavibacteria bacterium]|nr:cytochrome c nitrite reductase small subunit [Ignavibacteria bacterium]
MQKRIKNFISFFIPPEKWRIPVIIALGVFTGLLIFVIYIGKGTSYLSDDPEACVNCHVMYDSYASWWHSSHPRIATCNDCHVPHDNIFRKFYFKASDGLRHSTIFTLRLEPQVIRIKEAGAEVVKENCERCHHNLLTLLDAKIGDYDNEKDEEEEEIACWNCHNGTPHGKISSLSASPDVKVFKPTKVVPDWMEKYLSK